MQAAAWPSVANRVGGGDGDGNGVVLQLLLAAVVVAVVEVAGVRHAVWSVRQSTGLVPAFTQHQLTC